ncbi:unnamed protein product [Bursaphelenchus xylophilus]|uniref:Nicastrin n=1 Tax=Bursaphelenchus xylophilus TaxID=6326 RepID=A0A1I7S0U9_BURXY|nr:unnamed protein product [Bursaphelenchus xylophilus]CAG9088100.1 unnamed protein product [Bursaphelenchus xylophilus]
MLAGIVSVLSAVRVNDNIHIKLTSILNPCMRLLNGTHTFGCQSGREGNVGVVIEIKEYEEIEAAVKSLPWGFSELIALVAVNDLTSELLSKLVTSTSISGILLVRDRTRPFDGFSEDGISPNKEYSLYGEETLNWNEFGALSASGFLKTNVEKPIFFIRNSTEVELLYKNCYHAFNSKQSLFRERCVARLQSFMLGAGDARLCRLKEAKFSMTSADVRICDPLNDYNVFSMIPAVNAAVPKANLMVVAARMDSASIFSDSTGGDVSVLVSLISQLSAAKAVGSNRPKFEAMASKSKRQVLFSFFHGESFGYIGSSRWIYDLEENAKNKSKITKPEKFMKSLVLNDLSVMVETGLFSDSSQIYAHADGNVVKKFKLEMDQLAENLKKSQKKIETLFDDDHSQLPPSSIYSVLKKKSIPSLLLSPFKDKYTTKTLNSFFDTQLYEHPEKRDTVIKAAKDVAEVIRDVVVGHVGGDGAKPDDFKVDQQYVEKLVDCLIFDPFWNCSFFQKIFTNSTVIYHLNSHNTYIRVGGVSTIRAITSALLIEATGDTQSALNVKHEDECLAKNKDQNLYVYYWQLNVEKNEFACYKTTVYNTVAKSPAFEIEDYDLSNSTYSTFMESRWESVELELYLKADNQLLIEAAVTALIVLALSVILVIFLNDSWLVDRAGTGPTAV